MSAKKWLVCFVLTLLVLILSLGAFNWAVDPFGLFGDRFMNWYAYDMTQNPRSSKIAWLDAHHDEYDSYIIGCSSTSSYPTEALNRYFDARFFNMIMYGADMYDVECESRYIIENYECKNLVVNVYIDNGLHYDQESDEMTYSQHAKTEGSNLLSYYLRYLYAKPRYAIDKLMSASSDTYLKQSFDAFNPQDGTYDKRARDVEHISDTESYLEAYPVFGNYPIIHPVMTHIDDTVGSLARIKALCDQHEVNLVVVCAPVYYEYFHCFRREDVRRFYSEIAAVTPFWDFSMSSVSYEMRYFYDQTHFRNCVGDMALARIFSDHTVYVPEDFGVLVTPGNAEAHIDAIYQSGPAEETDVSAVVPTLLYHSISPEGDNGNGMVVSPETFEQQIAALSAGGYTAVSLEQVQDYVRSGEPLPEKPILITFDDGYQDNYTYAFPVLQKYHMQATVFVIGVQVGNKTYKGTDYPITPHLTDRQMKTMAASGLISFQTHSYDMHQSSAYEEGRARIDILQFEGEDEQAYIDLLKSDLKTADEQIAGIAGKEPIALAYPRGAYSELAATVIAQSGIAFTFTTEPGVNEVLKGVPQSLYGMHRRFVYEKTTPEQLLSYCSVARG